MSDFEESTGKYIELNYAAYEDPETIYDDIVNKEPVIVKFLNVDALLNIIKNSEYIPHLLHVRGEAECVDQQDTSIISKHFLIRNSLTLVCDNLSQDEFNRITPEFKCGILYLLNCDRMEIPPLFCEDCLEICCRGNKSSICENTNIKSIVTEEYLVTDENTIVVPSEEDDYIHEIRTFNKSVDVKIACRDKSYYFELKNNVCINVPSDCDELFIINKMNQTLNVEFTNQESVQKLALIGDFNISDTQFDNLISIDCPENLRERFPDVEFFDYETELKKVIEKSRLDIITFCRINGRFNVRFS